ncbi:hypothetical protein EQG73_09610 [Clostridium tetani]|nr:hypothetical protein EQG73_09610 [Clostridium tetani]QBD87779.1 hypothetical protein EW636_09600 [Clostridium tetani]
MKRYDSSKGKGLIYIFGETIFSNLIIVLLIYLTNSFELTYLLKVALIIVNIYEAYYILLYISVNYTIDEKSLNINIIRDLVIDKILIDDIQCYSRKTGKINGIKISGHGKDSFALGKSIIDKIGLTRMYVTSSKDVIYLKTKDTTYGISPQDGDKFEKFLEEKGVENSTWEYFTNKNIHLHNNKRYFIPFVISTILIIVLTLNPFIKYLKGSLPAKMPISFDPSFNPISFGTGKQFAFKQMVYGVLNMIVLLCMYYASYFYAKYDKRSAYKYIYISLGITMFFLIMQFKILNTF